MLYTDKEATKKTGLNWLERIHYGFTLLIIVILPFFAMFIELVKREYDIAFCFFIGITFYFLYRWKDRLHFPYREVFFHFLITILECLWVIILIVQPIYYNFLTDKTNVTFSDLRFAVVGMFGVFVVITLARFPNFVRLYTKGITTHAKITNIVVWAFAPRSFTELHFYLEFSDEKRITHKVISTNLYVPRLKAWNIGDKVDILYDPADPGRWVWINQ